MIKSNRYYNDIVQAEAGKIYHTKEGRAQAINACNVIINRIKKAKAWGMCFCGDDALIEYYERLKRCFIKEV